MRDWLPVKVSYFKRNGKYYSGIELLMPNDCSFYDRREHLDRKIDDVFPDSEFTFVSLDSAVLGWPYMKIPHKEGER